MGRTFNRKPPGSDGVNLPSLKDAPAGADKLEMARRQRAVQRKAAQDSAGSSDAGGRMHETAEKGVAEASSALPHVDQIQKSFGEHDVRGVKAAVGGEAGKASKSMNAQAYASGDKVGFKEAPDLHTAAHEAAHVVQQRAGVHLKSGVGKSGDTYEQHADAVADAVVSGKSAQGLLDEHAGASTDRGNAAVQHKSVQLLGESLHEPLSEGSETPAHGAHDPASSDNSEMLPEGSEEERGSTDQRQYSVEQYVAMWEEERGKKMTDQEKATLARGCIGITALNLEAVNPPLDNAYDTFEQAMAVVQDWNDFIQAHQGEKDESGNTIGDYKAVMFAKLFWSNQTPWDPSKSEEENRKAQSKKDPNAFKPDPKTGKVDMEGYNYQAQPNMDTKDEYFVNFDYGFWDEDSHCFWHANHCEPGMKVYQSTREKFTKGYMDFDRIIFCAAIAKQFDKGAAAEAHA